MDLLAEKFFLGLLCVFITNGPFIDGRTTGIEPACGRFTIHCLDPLGYIRPYPRTGLSLYLRSDRFRTNPYDRYQSEAFSYTISLLLCFGIRFKPWLQQLMPIAWQSFKGWAVHFIHFT
ncbi:Major capsid protein VP1 [Bienertia sinuspersici]